MKASNKFWRVAALLVLLVGMTSVGAAELFNPPDAGTQEWTYTEHTDSVNDVAVDSDGNVYSAGGFDDEEVHKIDSNGNQVWTYTGHNNNVEGVAADNDGNVYSASWDEEVHKIDSNGNQVWTYTGHNNNVEGVAADNDGNVYSASWDDEVHKIDSNGNQEWTYTGHTGTVYGVDADNDGNVYSGSLDEEVHKIDSNGNQVWTYTGHNNNVEGVAADNDGNVYSGSRDEEVHKIDSDGNNVWEYTGHTGTVFGVAVDQDRNVYSASQDDEAHKIDSTGNNVWEYTGHTGTVYGVDADNDGNVYSGSLDEEVHKLSFNEPPEFQSVSTSPDPPVIDTSSDVSFEASDDSEVSEVEVEWFRDGNLQADRTETYTEASVTDTFTDFYTPSEQGEHIIYFTATDDEGDSTTETLEYTEIEEDAAQSWVEIINPLNNAEFSASETEEDLNDDIEFENQLNPTDIEEDLTFTGVVTSPSGDTWTAFDNQNRQTPTGTSVSFSGTANAYGMVKDTDIGFDTEQNFGEYEYQIYWKEGHNQSVDENDFEYTDGPNTFTVEEAADRPEITWNSPQNNENFVIDKFESTLSFSDDVTSDQETFFNQPLNDDTYVIEQGETLDFDVIYSSRTSAFDEVQDIELWLDNDPTGYTGPDILPMSDGTLSDGETHTFTLDGNEHTIEVVSRDRDATPSTVDLLIDGTEQTFEDGEKLSIDEFNPDYSGDGDTDQGWVITVVSTTTFDPYHDQQTINVDAGLTGGNYDLRLEEYPNDEFSDTINIDVKEETLADVSFEYDLNIDEDEADTGIEFREGTDAFTEIFSDSVTSSGLLNHEETGLDLGEYEYYAFADTENYNVESETRSFTVTDEPLENEVGITLLNPDDGEVFNVNEGETQEVEAEASIDTTDYESSDELTLNWILDGTTDATQTINGGEELTESIIWGLGAGSYDWSVEVVDPEGESFSSETRTFEITEEDTTVNFDILTPSEGDQFLLNEEVLLSSTVESNVDGSKYHVVEDSTGSTVFESEETYLTSFDVYESNRTETFSEGDYSYYNRFEVDGSDSVFESSSVSFSVLDIDSPEIDLVNPEDGGQVVTDGNESFTVDFEFTASAEKTGDIELLVKESGDEEFELVESFSYSTENELETFEASQLFEGIEYPNEVNNILESSEYEWKVTFENQEFEIDYETDSSSWTFVEEEITTATGIVDRVLDFFRGYWEAFMDGTSTVGKAFLGLILMLVAGAIGFASAGSIGAGFGMAAMFIINTLVGLFPGWIAALLLLGGLGYIFVMRGD